MIQELNITISADRPYDGSNYNENVTFTCHSDHIYNIAHYVNSVQYQWSINIGKQKIIGSKTYTIQIRSVYLVTCEIFVKLSGARAIYGNRSIIIIHGKPLNYNYTTSQR